MVRDGQVSACLSISPDQIEDERWTGCREIIIIITFSNMVKSIEI